MRFKFTLVKLYKAFIFSFMLFIFINKDSSFRISLCFLVSVILAAVGMANMPPVPINNEFKDGICP